MAGIQAQGDWESWNTAPRLHIGNRVQGKDTFSRWDTPGLGDAAHPMTSQHVLLLEGMANHDAIQQARDLQDQTERKARMRSNVLMQINPTPEEKRALQANYRETLRLQIEEKAAAAQVVSSLDKKLAEGYKMNSQKTHKLAAQEASHRDFNRNIQLENAALARNREAKEIMERQLEKAEMVRTEDHFLNKFGTSL
eukprot:TRINITY_DN7245_c0_g1_i1.p1 TRINITY_DN7245_c0_g1~~TRINITY_DN7245_c0_g1_i1.p1  ORF type:complete len:196 (+),score=52.27 TRINITY_DN7245_c0_g1_i1:77-664(+)